MKKKRIMISLAISMFLAMSCWLVLPMEVRAANFSEVALALDSVNDDSHLDQQFVGANNATYGYMPVPEAPGIEAGISPMPIAVPGVIVYDQANLQAELDNGTPHITIAGSFTLTSPIVVSKTAAYQVLIDSTASSTLTAAAGQRHFNLATTNALHVTFENVILDGGGVGGGIQSSGIITLNTPQITNCFISAGTEGGGIYGSGSLRVSGGYISHCKALRGGGIMSAPGAALTVTGVGVYWNEANHTGTADSGLGGGIAVGQGGSIVAEDCVITNNVATGDNSNHKGLGGGIGAWINSYALVKNCVVANNSAQNFGGGIMSHWNSTLIVEGGTIVDNDVSHSTAFGTGGGVCSAAGSHLEIKDAATIARNKAQYGGGVRLEYSVTVLVDGHVQFNNNESIMTGGVFSCGSSVLEGSSTITIDEAQFNENTGRSGGGLYLGRGYNLKITDTTFTDNSVLNSGGVLYALPQSSVEFTEVTASGNQARYGGVTYMASAENIGNATPLIVTNSIIRNNEVDTVNVTGQGGGFLVGAFGSLTLTNSIVEENSGGYGGGLAIFSDAMVNVFGNTRITGNVATNSGGGAYMAARVVGSFNDTSQIDNNRANIGGGLYLSLNSILRIEDNTKVIGNEAIAYGGGIGASEAQLITVQDQAEISGNKAQEYGGGIYAHSGVGGTTIHIKDQSLISGNEANYGGGISGAYPDQETNVPNILLDDSVKIEKNVALNDGGGIWVPATALNKIQAASGIVFSENTASQAYYMSSTSPDVAIHQSHILTASFSNPPVGDPAFAYAYNNYDIVYRDGAVAVQVTFDGQGGEPALQIVGAVPGTGLTTSMPGNPIYVGYKFLGWYTQPDGGGTLFTGDTIVNDNMTVYAYWELVPVEPPTPSKPGDGSTIIQIPKTGQMGLIWIGGSMLVLGVGISLGLGRHKKK